MKKIILLLLVSLMSSFGYAQYEDFELPGEPDAVTGQWGLSTGTWLVKDNRLNAPLNWQSNEGTPYAAYGGSRAAFVNRENTGAGVYAEEWLITPQFTVPANQQIRFFTRQTLTGDQGTLYRVMVSSNADPSILTAYTQLAEYTETQLSSLTTDQLDYEEKIINLAFTGARYFAFVKVFTQPAAATAGDRWLIDDFRIATRCLEPTTLAASNITGTSATLGWTATATTYNIEYGLSGFTPGTGTVVTGIADGGANDTYTIPSGTLTPGACYQFYVTAICGSGATATSSLQTGPFNFCTTPLGSTCADPGIIPPTLPQSVSSNTGLYGNNITNATPGTSCGVTGNFLGGNDVVYSYTPATTGIINVQMDPHGTANTGVFVYSTCANIGVNCIAGVGNNNGNIREIQTLNVTAGVPVYIVVSSTAAVGSFDYTLTLQAVNCAPPTGLSSVGVSQTEASISWQNPGGAAAWEYYVQTAGAGVPTGAGIPSTTNTNISVTETSDTNTPLVFGTNYQFWVRAACGDGTFSLWAGPYVFTTTNCTGGGCSYTFTLTDSFGDGWNGAVINVIQNSTTIAQLGPTFTDGTGPVVVNVPVCNGPISVVWQTAGTFPGEVRFTMQNSFGQTLYAITTASAALAGTTLYNGTVDCANPSCLPPLNLTSTTPTPHGATLNWVNNGTVTPVSWEVFVTTPGSPAPTAASTPIATVAGGAAPPFVLSDPSILPDTDYVFYVRAVCSTPGANDWSVVSPTFHTLPTCPKPTGLVLDQFDLNSIRFDWVPGFTETAWEYIVVAAGSPVPAANDPNWVPTSTHPVTVGGLTSATSYDFYVRAICTQDVDESTIAGPATGNTTICPLADQCAYTFTLTDSFGDGWNGARMQVRQNGIVVGTLGTTFTGGAGPIVETVMLCNTLPFELFWSTAGTFPGEVRISVQNGFNQTLYAMTTASAGLAGTVLYTGTVDCDNPACLPPLNLTASAPTAYGATLNWTNNGTVLPASWDIYVVPAGSPAPTAATVPTITGVSSASAPPYTFSLPGTISPDTDYVYYVRAVCTTPGANDWSIVSPVFHTIPTCPKPTALVTDQYDFNSVRLDWAPGGTETAWEYIVVAAGSPVPAANDPAWVPTSAHPVTITGLTEATAYDFYVRAICTQDVDESTISGPVAGNTTICNASEQCAYTFTLTDSFGDGWNGARMQVRQNGIVVATLGTTFTGGLGPIVETVNICPGIPLDLFWSVPGTFPGEVRISVQNSFGQTIYAMTTASAGLAGTVLYSNATPSCTVPECQAPFGLAAAPYITNGSLSWLPDLAGLTYDVYVVTTGSPAPTATSTTPYTNVTSPFVLPEGSLLPETQYTFYVRMHCPDGNGVSGWSTGFNFTTLPTCPQPQSLSISTTTTDATITFTEANPTTTQWEVWVLDPGAPAPTPGTGIIVNQTPNNMIVTINTATDLGLTLFPGFHNFYVQAICSPTDSSALNGPTSFFIQSLDPVCADVVPDNPNINADGEIDLCPGNNCVDLTATYVENKQTDTYLVESIPFVPPFPFIGGTDLPINIDDIWGPVVHLPFNFCFFGVNSQDIQVGSNGVVTFDATHPVGVGGGCPWAFTQTIPNTNFPILNAIYGVYQDTNPAVSAAPQVTSINYQVLGTAPCRTFVVNFYQVAQFSCGTSVGLQTSQIVLYETSNIVEVFVKDRTVCTGWNSGSGVIGIQNAAGTQAHFPPGRNTGPWTAHDEGWRFKPNGASNVTFTWYKDGAFYSNDTSINVCVDQTTTMTAEASYLGCGGVVTVKTSDVILRVNEIDVDEVQNVTQCDCYVLPQLTVGEYHDQPGGLGNVIPAGTQICNNQTIYVYAELVTATQTCTDEAQFDVTIAPAVAPVLPDQAACDSFTLPNLNDPNYNYYLDTNGGGISYPGTGGTVIDTPGTIYIYGGTSGCMAESSFVVSIGAVDAFEQPDVSDCNGFVLPDLPPGQNYYNASGGQGAPIPVGTLIDTDQTIYIFVGQGTCTDESDFIVTVPGQIIPVFDPIPAICLNAAAPALPLVSNAPDSVPGTWSPATIDTSVAGTFTYTFTPDGTIPCAVQTTIDITISAPVTPTFAAIPNVCIGAAVTLPTVSNENISGTWSPAVDTSMVGTTTYTFTPDAGQGCVLTATVDVTVVPSITPVFDPIANICQNTAAPSLPLISNAPDSVPGTWSPATIDTSVAGTVTYTFTPDATVAPCAVPVTINVTVDPSTTPTFTAIADACVGAVVTLPTTSNNGITGTWDALVDTSVAGTFTFTFTPSAGQPCALTTTLTVTVIAPQTPAFSTIPANVCFGSAAPTLPGVSDNGITGTWLPGTVDTTLSGVYTFTPDLGQCAVPTIVNITVLPTTTPTFDPIAQICAGGSFTLPTTSLNGIAGTWSPAPDFQNTTTYTFTANAGQCAGTATLTVTVIQNVNPSFAEIGTLCQGAPEPTLATTSPSGLTGTWSPSVVDTDTPGSTTYTFTPDAGQCAVPQSLTVVIVTLPDFGLSGGCDGNNYVLAPVPLNGYDEDGVTYIWTDSAGNQVGDESTLTVTQTGVYNLSVSMGSCSQTKSIDVTTTSCFIQRGISPGDGNKNDFFDLAGLNVRRLEIFNRYGTKVYSQVNYSKEWYGQSDKGDELPDGTYYYVIERDTETKTGWIYINRVK